LYVFHAPGGPNEFQDLGSVQSVDFLVYLCVCVCDPHT
jgi:hypothetical protein